MDNLIYFLDGKTYINITNSCTNRCVFCIRNIKDDVKGANLWLEKDNATFEDVIAELLRVKEKIGSEIVFCGYGEPMLRHAEVLKVAKYIKENLPDTKVRINTNAHGSLVAKRDIVPDFAPYVDEFSISLNAQNEEIYNKISKPQIEGAYFAMLDFAKSCVRHNIKTVMSVVTGFDDTKIDIKECEKIANSIGAEFRERKFEKNGY